MTTPPLKCRFCGRELQPHMDFETVRVETPNLVGSTDMKLVDRPVQKGVGYLGEGLFCKTLCGYGWARRRILGRRRAN